MSLIFSVPTGVFHNAMIKICRHVAPSTKNFNYDHSLWRGAQLYAVSFIYCTMSVVAGTYSAGRAYFLDHDLSMWSSFRVSDTALTEVNSKWI